MASPFYRITFKLLSYFLRFITFFKQNHILNLSQDKCQKVNLGAGLRVHKDWINIDYNLPSLFAKYPKWFLRFLYRVLKTNEYSELDRPYRFSVSEEMFIKLLTENTFVAHNLFYGIPFSADTISYYYSSHMFGFSFSKDASQMLFKEIFRTLKKGGKIRLSFDGQPYPGQEKKAISNPNSFTEVELKNCLDKAGFSNIKRFTFRNGTVPDLMHLDDYSPEIDLLIGVETIYIEAEK